MNVLLTAGGVDSCTELAEHLAQTYQVRLTERVDVETEHEFVQCGLGHDYSTNLLVRGMDVIIHLLEALPGENDSQQLDTATRCTYNLLMAATEEGVPRVILLSTLQLMADYDDAYRVDERWRPLPRPEPRTLTKHLAEQISREFAREHKLAVTILRLGDVSTETVAKAVDEVLANEGGDAAEPRALHRRRDWAIVHVGEEKV